MHYWETCWEAGTIWPSQSPWCNASGTGAEERWIPAILHWFQKTQCMQTKKDSYPLPSIQEALESMARAAHFSTMDFKSGFWQVHMAPRVTAVYHAFMVSNLGFLWVYKDALFIVQHAPVTFQNLMQNMLGELNLTYCVIYLDNMIVFGCTEEEHLECLWLVLECFTEFNLKLKASKCFFFQMEIVYLRDHVSKEGICPSEENVCMPTWSFPFWKLIPK